MAATHSEGMQLHLSARSTSGYQYVVAKPNGKFQVDVKNKFLGSFNTAVEAAVCVANHLALPTSRGEKRALLASSGSADGGGSAQAEARDGKRQAAVQEWWPPPPPPAAASRRGSEPRLAVACVAVAAVAEGARTVVAGWTDEEDERIMSLVRASGTRWSEIALALGGGRTNDAVRNRYNRIKRTAAAGTSTAADARRRPEPQPTKSPTTLVVAPTSAAVQPAAGARRPFTLAPGLPDRAPGDRNGKELFVGSRVQDEQGVVGEIIKRSGAWLKMRTDAGKEYSVRRRSVEVLDAATAAEPLQMPARMAAALAARREGGPLQPLGQRRSSPAAPSAPRARAAAARPAAASAPLARPARAAAAPAAGPLATQPTVTALAPHALSNAIAPIPPPEVFVGIFFDPASGGWCFHAAGRTTRGFPSALAALAACESQESPQVTVPPTHSSLRVA